MRGATRGGEAGISTVCHIWSAEESLGRGMKGKKGQDTAGGTSTSAHDLPRRQKHVQAQAPSLLQRLHVRCFVKPAWTLERRILAQKMNYSFDRKVGLSSGVGEIGKVGGNVVDGSDTQACIRGWHGTGRGN